MVSTRVKVFIQRLATDADFRRAFSRDPERVLAAEALAAEEHRALRRLHVRLAPSGDAELVSSQPAQWP